ncbi:hypothetical protein AB0L71_10330 [Streptomyces sp. NPDC052052]
MDDQVTPLPERIDARERELADDTAQIRAQMTSSPRACVNSTRRSRAWR